jgi:hypothetical protein
MIADALPVEGPADGVTLSEVGADRFRDAPGLACP